MATIKQKWGFWKQDTSTPFYVLPLSPKTNASNDLAFAVSDQQSIARTGENCDV